MSDEDGAFEITDARVDFPIVEVDFELPEVMPGYTPTIVYEFDMHEVFEVNEGEFVGATDDSIIYEDPDGEQHEIEVLRFIEDEVDA